MYDNLFYDKKVNALFSDKATVTYMLQFEAALAQAQAHHAFIPHDAADAIAEICKIENIDMVKLIEDVRLGANVPIPLVKQLTTLKPQSSSPNPANKYVHFGATSQDVVDTALMLQVRDAVEIIVINVNIVINQLVFLIENHRETLMMGRSFMQQAKPITFGFKVATWLDGVLRTKKRLLYILKENFTVQLGGAVGHLSSMPKIGFEITETLGGILKLNTPSLSWHTQRDRFVEISTTLGILTGTLSKIAKDVSLLMQTEIAEVFEPSGAGKGGSSTMPHKRNPVSSIALLAIAQRVPPLVSTMLSSMTQDHERATGAWHAEWETIADIVKLSAGAVRHAVEMTNGLEVNTDQMLKNIDCTEGLIFAENVSLALSSKIGKAAAHELVENACKIAVLTKKHLKSVLREDKNVNEHLTDKELKACFKPENSIGLCNVFIDNVLKNV
jgi:3-carboxy-cis,cis-muconate cycloisomerase